MPSQKRTKKKLTEYDKYKKEPWNSPKDLIFVSPDHGETVYIQKKNGERGKMVSQSQLAKDIELAYDENEMVGEPAIKLRRKYPTLQKAWNRYKTVWHLINEEN